MASPTSRSSLRLRGGSALSFVTAGNPQQPALVLLHGFPSSAETFRGVWSTLADVAFVVAPDLPGFGRSEVLPTTTFDDLAAAVSELLDHLKVGERFIYLHDFGAPVGLQLAMDTPALVRGLIIQNANAHSTGFGPQWAATRQFWAHRDADNEAAATTHLTHDGIRDQYVAGIPADLAQLMDPDVWEEDWRVMRQPGRLDAQRALIADYGNYAGRFDVIADYLRRDEPPALMVWGRHDIFFDLAEVVSWMQDLPRMEAHILDGAHFLLETHAAPTAALIRAFIEHTNSTYSGT